MAPLIKIAALLNLSLLVASQGTQFITGPCTSDADCASGCCGFNTGKCAGAVIALERDGGCGFGDASPNGNAAQALGFTGPVPGGDAANTNGNAQGGNDAAAATPAGTQFITGACVSDADCASGCCGFNTGKCAGAVVALERDGGCGFGDASPNGNAAQALGFSGNIPRSEITSRAAQGTQFITGECAADADCASGCCGFNTGKCAGAVVALERDGGCGFGDASPNGNAAQALGFTGEVPGGNNNANVNANGNANGNADAAATPAGTQFITGPCTSDADCSSGCCGFNTGKCAGAVVAQERDGGCGFGDASPNDDAAQALRGQRLGKRGVSYWM